MSRRSPHLVAATLVLAGLLGGHVVIETGYSDPAENPLATLLAARDWPVLSHLLAALPALLALAGLLLSRRTLAVPAPKVGVPLALLGGLAWSAVLFASNRSAALLGAVEWSAYGLLFFAVVAGGGRSNARMLLGAVAIGGTAAAALAIRQYGEVKGFDPGFRAQGPWNNPNAVGAYLGIALVATLSLVPTSERVGKLAALLGATIVGFGLALTQSRGAYATAGLGLLVWIGALGLTRSRQVVAAVGSAAATLALAALLSFAATRPPANAAGGGGAFGRLGNAQEASVQSVGFRQLLWRTAADLTTANPIGDGLNSFGPRSAQPGLVTQTQLAHSTPLQLAAEISPVGAGLFVLFFGVVAFVSARGARRLEESRKGAFAGAAGALAGALAHNLFDSDAYYFGLGATLFALAGILLLAGSDTSAPELVPVNWRWAGGAGIAALLAVWTGVATVDRTAATARGLALAGRIESARAALAGLGPLIDTDGRLLSRRALVATTSEERLRDLRRAADLSPSTRNFRALASERVRQRDPENAIRAYEQALKLDPNNFLALAGLRNVYEAEGRVSEAEQIARRTIAVEGSTYFTVRSQPELVVVATADARRFVAGRLPQDPGAIEMLLPALEMYRQYATITVPVVVRFDDGSGGGDYGGENRERAQEAIAGGQDVIARLRALGYRDRARLEAAEAAFARADEALRRDSVAR